MLVGAILTNVGNTDETDGEVVAHDEDILNASLRSNQSIQEANMTLKPWKHDLSFSNTKR